MTDEQIVDLSKLIGETPDATRSALGAAARVNSPELMAEIEADLIAMLAEYEPVRNAGGFKMAGGRDGIVLDDSVTAAELRAEARRLLNLPELQRAGDLQVVNMSGGRWL